MSSLSLGTAQFGSHYGITNSNGPISPLEITSILKLAYDSEILFLDTAQAYGEAELRLGKNSNYLEKFKVSTKLCSISGKNFTGLIIEECDRSFHASLNRLSLNKIDCLLLHDQQDFYKHNSILLINWLKSLKQEKLVKRIGVSIYSPSEIYSLPLDIIDVIQLPLSLYNQSFLLNKHLEFLLSHGISIHIRSIFLQGLLLEKFLPEQFPNDFCNHHKMYLDVCKLCNITPLEFIFDFIKKVPGIEAVLIGITSNNELNEIIYSWNNINPTSLALSDYKKFHWSNIADIDPRRWRSP